MQPEACGPNVAQMWPTKALVFASFFRCKMEQKQMVMAKCHKNFIRPFFRSLQKGNQSFFSTTKSSEDQKKVFILNLGDIWAGTAISTTTLACSLILLCMFTPAALKVVHL